MPYSVFLIPPFSRVGLSEKEAVEKGYKVKVARLAAAAIPMGGNVRVGFEDTVYLSKGVLAKSNGELVARVVELANLLGRPVANPAEARKILSLG